MATNVRELDVQETVDVLMSELECEDVVKCQKARAWLVTIGRPAVPALVKSLSSGDEWARWKAAKALGEIADPLAAEALVRALEDEAVGVRWLAAEGLVAIGRTALVPLLEVLIERPDSVWLREGARHVIHDVERTGSTPDALKLLLATLEDIGPSVDVTLAAWNALEALTGDTDR